MPKPFDTVALLSAVPSAGLARGQVGTVVEALDNDTVLVEFSGDDGRAYAIVPCPRAGLLVLHYMPETAARLQATRRSSTRSKARRVSRRWRIDT